MEGDITDANKITISALSAFAVGLFGWVVMEILKKIFGLFIN